MAIFAYTLWMESHHVNKAPPPMSPSENKPRVGLFATCLVDLLRPAVGFASAKLLEQAGFVVEVPAGQTCCGQPALNSGDLPHARRLAEQHIALFEPYDYVVLPSGSCAGSVRMYAECFTEAHWQRRAEALAAKTFELTDFLTRHGIALEPCAQPTDATYHDSCSSLRQMGVEQQPRDLLAARGIRVQELEGREVCCGFGGTFCVKYPEISARMVGDKADAVAATGAGILLGGDLGCLLHIGGHLRRRALPVRVFHVAEALAGELQGPGLGCEDAER
jgi:L-lactate dehydrogenase complex protein LldE